MLGIIGIVAIILAVVLTVARPQQRRKRLWLEFGSYAFAAGLMSWVAGSTFIDGERLLPAVAAVAVAVNTWRLIQIGVKMHTPKKS